MKIEKKFKEKDSKWVKTTIDECLDKTEGSGYWKMGSVVEGLKMGLYVFTPFSIYRCIEYIENGETRINKF